MKLRNILLFSGVIFFLFLVSGASSEINIVASTSDLAYFARIISGGKAKVASIAPPDADIHYVEVRPSYMIKTKEADLILKVGMELDIWMDRIIDGSRNSEAIIIDCSKYIKPLEVPSFKADARYGDLHRFGNPHYWLSPENAKPITLAIEEGLAKVDPPNADFYRESRLTFLSQVEADAAKLKAMAAPLKDKKIVFYHDSWPYFNSYFEILAAGFIEPFPGVPPSASHISKMIEIVREEKISVIAMEPYFDRRVPDKIASETGTNVVTLYPSIGGREENESYYQWLEGNIRVLLEAAK
jgi:ABC-type Zn uptake system ZnuABC Zn-binding protein ZnuA